MNVTSVEKNENSTAKLVVEIEKAQFQAALDKAYRAVKNDVYIPGFRKGKAPRKIVEKMYGAQVFYEDAINDLFPAVWAEAVEKSELNVVGSPNIADLNVNDEGTLVLTVETGLYPEVTLGQYKGIEAEKTVAEVTEADIDAEVEKLAKRNSSKKSAERPAQMGDETIIDYEGFNDGVPFEGGKGENQSLTLGSGVFIPGFEEQVVGMEIGQEKEINVTFPEDYGEASLAGKPCVFKVKLNDIKETITPEIDDEFAKDVSETADTLEELRAELKEKLAKEKEEEAENAFKSAVMEKAMDNMTAVIPDQMVEAQLDSIMDQYSASMQQSGFTLEQYCQMLGTTEAQIREQNRAGALATIRNTLLCTAVAEAENIEVPAEDIEAYYAKMAEEYEMEVEKVKEYVPTADVENEQKLQKAMDLIIESAVVAAPEAAE